MEKKVYLRQIANEKTHWWFAGRRKLIDLLINRIIKKKNLLILDFGSGSGTNIKTLSQFGTVHVYEKDKSTLKFLLKNYLRSRRIRILKKMDKTKKYDIILAADVIEHIKDDKKIINFFHSKLKEKGKLILTVPAFNGLYSKKDETLGHFRRYNSKSLSSLLEKKFNIIKFSFFNFFLFIPISILIIIFKIIKFNFIEEVEKTPNYIINKILTKILYFEVLLLKIINLPFGLSILAVSEKK